MTCVYIDIILEPCACSLSFFAKKRLKQFKKKQEREREREIEWSLLQPFEFVLDACDVIYIFVGGWHNKILFRL